MEKFYIFKTKKVKKLRQNYAKFGLPLEVQILKDEEITKQLTMMILAKI